MELFAMADENSKVVVEYPSGARLMVVTREALQRLVEEDRQKFVLLSPGDDSPFASEYDDKQVNALRSLIENCMACIDVVSADASARVLILCEPHQSKSRLVVLAHLIARHGHTAKSAIAHLNRIQPLVLDDSLCLRLLDEWEAKYLRTNDELRASCEKLVS